jgi:uncharacterized protein
MVVGALGMEIHPAMPFAAALIISSFTSMGGISGAFALVPFQMVLLGTAAPVVSATNHLFNVVAIPGGVIQYLRSGRLAWPLVALLAAGSVPGSIGGVWIRVHHLSDAGNFRLFAAGVLLLLALQLLWLSFRPGGGRVPRPGAAVCRLTPRVGTVTFAGREHVFSPGAVILLSLSAGWVGGAYGIGGGVITAPLLVALFRLPIHAVAGATLLATLLASIAAVLSYQSLSLVAAGVGPDWGLGLVMGMGGLAGISLGSRLQGRLSPRVIQWILSGSVAVVAVRYLVSG